MAPKMYDLAAAIIDYETEGLDEQGELELFCNIINTKAYQWLQGHYGRTAQALLNAGRLVMVGNRCEVA